MVRHQHNFSNALKLLLQGHNQADIAISFVHELCRGPGHFLLLLRVQFSVIPQAVAEAAEAVGVFGGDGSAEVEDDVS